MRQVGIGGIASLVGVLGVITCSYRCNDTTRYVEAETPPAIEWYEQGILIHEGNLSKKTTLADIAQNNLLVSLANEQQIGSGRMASYEFAQSIYAIPMLICYELTLENEIHAVADLYSEKLDPKDSREFFCQVEYVSPV